MGTFELVLTAVGCCVALSLLSASLTGRVNQTQRSGVLNSFLLADGSLSKIPIISLLVSSSSSLNSLFYQVWLGYSVGAWALVAQGAWALSFFFLARFSDRILSAQSLHGFLAESFGQRTRIIAALCTVLGFMALMGWEVSLGRQVFGGFVATDSNMAKSVVSTASQWLAGLTVIGALIYTLTGGLRGNAAADVFQNVLKLLGFGVLMVLLLANVGNLDGAWGHFWNSMFPSVETMSERLGWFGLLTNIVFSFFWQPVDASTWQGVLAGRRSEAGQISNDLRWSGVTVFIAPGILGTILGVSLTTIAGVNQDNILVMALDAAGSDPWVQFLFFFAISAAIMSLIDGLLIASAYAIVVDLFGKGSTLVEIDESPERAIQILSYLRVAIVVLAVMAAWGVHSIMNEFDLSPFDILYLVIIPQLALLGPVLVAIFGKTRQQESKVTQMVWAIIAALVTGLVMTWVGMSWQISKLVDGAGTATAMVSLLVASMLWKAASKERVA